MTGGTEKVRSVCVVDWIAPSAGPTCMIAPLELVRISRPPARMGPNHVSGPALSSSSRQRGSCVIHFTLPLERAMASSCESSVTTKIHSPATQGVAMPAALISQMRWPVTSSSATMRPPWPIA